MYSNRFLMLATIIIYTWQTWKMMEMYLSYSTHTFHAWFHSHLNISMWKWVIVQIARVFFHCDKRFFAYKSMLVVKENEELVFAYSEMKVANFHFRMVIMWCMFRNGYWRTMAWQGNNRCARGTIDCTYVSYKKCLLLKNKRVFDLMEHESTNKSVDRIIMENLVSIYFYRTFSFYWQIEHVKL